MGKHRTPHGEASTSQGAQSLTGRKPDPNHEGKHRAEDKEKKVAGSDLPPRSGGKRTDGK